MENQERLTLELTNYILDAYKKRKDLDYNYINELGDIVKSNLGLSDYVREIEVRDIANNSLAMYTLKEKKIVYDINKIVNYLFSIRGLNISYDSRLLFYYIELAEYLLHEMEHAIQSKNVNNHNSKLESRLLMGSMIFECVKNDSNKYQEVLDSFQDKDKIRDYFQEKRKIYLKDYELAVEERLAAYHANMMIVKILNSFKDNNDLWKYKVYTLLNHILVGYNMSLNPTEQYLKKLGTTRLFTDKELKGLDMDLGTRLSLGLKITREEKEELDDLATKMEYVVFR